MLGIVDMHHIITLLAISYFYNISILHEGGHMPSIVDTILTLLSI